MNSQIISSLVNSINLRIHQADVICNIASEIDCSSKKDNQISNSIRILASTISDYLEKALLEINNAGEIKRELDIDEFTLPICIAKELCETLVILNRNFNSGSHILSSSIKQYRTFAADLKHLYEIEVNKFVNDLQDPSGDTSSSEGKVC